MTEPPAEAPTPLPGERPADGLRARAARGTMVNAAFLVGLDTLSLVKGFLVAGFLSQEEYGVWGILVVALGTLAVLKEVGIGDKYVQQDEADQELAFQKAFTLEAAANLVLLCLVLAALPLFVVLYGESDLLAPGAALALTIPAVTFQSPLWVFYRRMNFLRQRTLQAVDPLTAFAVTIALAAGGAGYWSLVAGALAGRWAGAAAALLASPYRLRWRWERGALREYASFSWPLLVGTTSGMVAAQASMLAGEEALGLEGAGAIALASTITLYTDKVDAIVTSTLYPAICSVRDRVELLHEAFVKTNRLTLMWGVPFGIALALFAPDLVEFGLGERWEPAVGLLQAFGAIAALNHVAFNWSAFFRAVGNTRPIAVVSALTTAVFLAVAIPLLLADGLDGFAVGMGVSALAALAGRAWYLSRMFDGFRLILHALRGVAPTVPAAAAVLAARALESGERTGGVALAELALYLAVTVAATAILERPLLREVAGYLRGRGRLIGSPA
jgi:O-antigen/teichoic acid export membrane protein